MKWVFLLLLSMFCCCFFLSQSIRNFDKPKSFLFCWKEEWTKMNWSETGKNGYAFHTLTMFSLLVVDITEFSNHPSIHPFNSIQVKCISYLFVMVRNNNQILFVHYSLVSLLLFMIDKLTWMNVAQFFLFVVVVDWRWKWVTD